MHKHPLINIPSASRRLTLLDSAREQLLPRELPRISGRFSAKAATVARPVAVVGTIR